MEIKNILFSFFNDFLIILGEMSPFLILGFFFAGLLYAFMPRQKIERYFSGKPVKSSIFGSLLGVPLPLCSCGVIPTGIALYKNGASKGGTVSFLISTPQTGIDSILATFSLMGLPFAIFRPIAALITGITGGIITSKFTTESTQPGSRIINKEEPTKSFKQKIKDVFWYGFVEFIQDISKWLLIGLILAAVISALIPDNFVDLLNLSPLMQMFIILLVSIPLYICATGSIPLAAILILKGVSPGAAFVLLMAGPATNAATITMIGKVLGKRTLFIYLGTIISGALLSGLFIDYLLPTGWFIQIAHQHLGHEHSEQITWLQIVSGSLLLGFIANGYIQKIITNKKSNHHTITNITVETKTIKVEGMTCNHCKTNIETNLKNLSFITEAKVNLVNKTIDLKGNNIYLNLVKETINSLGYNCQ
ncbi:MAG: permease [Bacteroidales bacterium]|nr:permease [Bacteroidales bacterium]